MPLLPPILSASLPPPPGPLKNIAYAHLTSHPLVPFSIPSPTLVETGKPALEIKEISYCLFYPADLDVGRHTGKQNQKGKGRGVGWVPEPFWGVVKGYERFMGDRTGMRWLASTLGVIAGRLKMPVHPLVSLLPPPASGITKKYPLVIFSHGLAGTRHTYSQYCSALASEGYVVLSIEHRDGSGPAVQFSPDIPTPASGDAADDLTIQEGGGNEVKENEGEGEGRVLHYIKQGDLQWSEGQDPNRTLMHFRSAQLDIRVREVYEAYHSFKQLLTASKETCSDPPSQDRRGDRASTPTTTTTATTTTIAGLDGQERKEWLESFVDRVDWEDVRLTGHSFGGGTILHLLQTPPPSAHYAKLPTTQAIALDPWLEALPLPAPKTEGSPDMPLLLVLNSMGFTEWTDHFKRVLKIVKEARGSLMTVVGVGHQAFSDFPLLSPTSHSSASFLLRRIHELSLSFLQDDLAQSPLLADRKPDQGAYEKEVDGNTMRARKSMKAGEVVWHLASGE